MEVSKISENGIKIKGKTTVIGINPFSVKGPIDAAIIFNKEDEKIGKTLEGEPLLITGPGEYEVKGTKISGHGSANSLVFTARVDNIRICVLNSSTLHKAKDILEECDIIISEADVIPEQKLLVGLNPNVIIFYGQQAQESANSLGKQVNSVSKYSVTREKLPSEMEVVVIN